VSLLARKLPMEIGALEEAVREVLRPLVREEVERAVERAKLEQRFLPAAQAAERLGISVGAVRRRVKRGQLPGQNVEGLVISLLHSYRRPDHERQARAVAEKTAPGLPVTVSSDVWPQAREYERTALAVVDAYVQPKVRRYLEGFEQALAARGAPAMPHVTKSNGGIMPVAAARTQTAATLLCDVATERTRRVILAHVSRTNNRPDLAVSATRREFERRGRRTPDLHPAVQASPSTWFHA